MSTTVPTSIDQIERERPAGWEILLFASLLEEGLRPVRRSYDELHQRQWRGQRRALSLDQTKRCCVERINAIKSLVVRLHGNFNAELARAAGPPGVPGDPVVIRSAVAQVVSDCQALYDWESSVLSVEPHPVAADLYSRLSFCTLSWFAQVEQLPARFRSIIAAGKPGSFTLDINFDTPDAIKNLPDTNRFWPRLWGALGLVALGSWLFNDDD